MLLDQNHDGSLSKEEISRAEEIISKLDGDGDGNISMHEIFNSLHSSSGKTHARQQTPSPKTDGQDNDQSPQDNGSDLYGH